jgi:CheY-like chemotaxis protein
LPRTVSDVVATLDPAARKKKLRLIRSVAEDARLEVVGDQSRFRQILLNLVGNAVKFTETGEVEIAVSTLARSPETITLRCEVRDTGIGIARELQNRLFESFTQGDSSSTRKYGGTGLGLAICRQLLALMGGSLEFESEAGRGSRFWFVVPFAFPAAQASANRTVHGRRRVLVVEDNLINQKIAGHMLHKSGCEAEMVSNGREALDALQASTYDLVLMDLQMPVLDGFQATAELRRRENGGAHIPVVAMTANAMNGDRERCLAAGMDDYIAKPVRFHDLVALLDRILGTGGADSGRYENQAAAQPSVR